MNHLFRELAPITESAWEQIEEEADRSLRHFLAGRKLLSLSGPHGWKHSTLDLGSTVDLDTPPVEGAEAAMRQFLPLIEVRTPFTLSRKDLATADRGHDIDTEAIVEASRVAAASEDTAIFHGYEPGMVEGLTTNSPHQVVTITDDYADYPSHVADAVAELRGAGVEGPYAVALGPRCYTGVIESTELGGYPVFDHIKRILGGGPIVWAPAVDGAVVLSQRGGDSQITIGEDFAIGYAGTDGDSVQLYLEESFTFRVTGPEAAVALRYP